MNKNPKSRIGVIDKGEIKRHPFFKGIDWTKLYARETNPPVHLRMDDESGNEDYLEEMQYLKQVEKAKFKDQDYQKDNKTLNRVK